MTSCRIVIAAGVPTENIESQKGEIFGYANTNAKERVKGAFILGRIADKEGIRVAQEDLVQRVTQLAAQNQMTFQKMVKELQDRGALATVRDQVLVGKALEFVVQHAQVEEVAAGTLEAEAAAKAGERRVRNFFLPVCFSESPAKRWGLFVWFESATKRRIAHAPPGPLMLKRESVLEHVRSAPRSMA